VINLAGASIFGKWTPRRKRQIEESRAAATANVIAALAGSRRRKAVLVSASAVGYYGFHGDEELGRECAAGRRLSGPCHEALGGSRAQGGR